MRWAVEHEQPRPDRAAAAGFLFSLIDSVGQIRVVLNMLADRSLVRVISSPR